MSRDVTPGHKPTKIEIGLLLFIAILFAATLAGCATLTTAISTICDNREIVQDQAERQLQAAEDIADPTKRAAVLAIATFTLAALEKCPRSTLTR